MNNRKQNDKSIRRRPFITAAALKNFLGASILTSVSSQVAVTTDAVIVSHMTGPDAMSTFILEKESIHAVFLYTGRKWGRNYADSTLVNGASHKHMYGTNVVTMNICQQEEGNQPLPTPYP
ncbi:MAG: hypothetical protein IKU76_00675 [Bacteroidaceae bacterium]|nr:hypothetical protein [Bacteroidaceae bacterium]